MDVTSIANLRSAGPSAQVEQTRAQPAQTPAVSLPVVADNGINVTATKDIRTLLPSEADIKRSLDTINKYLKPNAIEFSLDQDTGQTLVKIVDTETETVIRQIPTEQVVEISKDLSRLQGLLFRTKA